ncbi:MAG: hypothetical protein HQ591_05685 [candidate division Zixibacteria bacterium]|nr:hypothetical protein [Candidatus Tariuqbacter arcticus]
MDTQVKKYLARLRTIYEEIEGWLAEDKQLRIAYKEYSIKELSSVSYKAPKLLITDDSGKLVAELIPKGAWVVSAEGLIDIKGEMGIDNLLYLTKNPPITTHVAVGSQKLWNSPSVYSNIELEGWYWIDPNSMEPILVEKELFKELVEQASFYEFDSTN